MDTRAITRTPEIFNQKLNLAKPIFQLKQTQLQIKKKKKYSNLLLTHFSILSKTLAMQY